MTKANRKVLLLVDNCMAHKCPTSLKYIKLQFLPPNATSKPQPLDPGIIKHFKQFYRKEVAKILMNDMKEGARTSQDCVQDSEEWLVVKNHFNLDERFDDFVTFGDNVSTTGLITDDDIVDSVLNRNTLDIVEEDEEVENIITAKEAKQMVEKLQTFLEAQEAIPKSAFDSLASVERNIFKLINETLNLGISTDDDSNRSANSSNSGSSTAADS
ncbi:tigger transposable element-derived protein 6-like [Anastrepha ludens]|uniref:tigger transposable element-derived protein 6-like n=1 Tax=Anastrepha ludens TaxID=28586 RepID=UPI0023AFB2A8|nr:tigger transposable element-derived protein 6-like [Anastrepha ludens]